MLKIILALLFISSSCLADEWSQDDKYREATYLVLHSVDWLQTRNIARQPKKYFEYNSLIGKHPTIGKVNNYFAISTLTHIGIIYLLPEDYRKTFQYATIGFKGGLVYHNIQVGLSARF